MADNLPTQPGQGQKKDLSMELRLLLAFVLMGLVLFVTPYIYKPPAGPKRSAPPTTPSQAAQVTKPAPAASKAAEATAAPTTAPTGQITADKEQSFAIDTALYHIELSNKGGVVTHWVLNKFLDSQGHKLELVNTSALAKAPGPFSVIFKNGDQASNINYALFKATPTGDKLGVDFEYSDGKTDCKKSFRFDKNSYLSRVTSEVTQNGTPVPPLLEWRGGFGDLGVQNRQAAQQVVYYDLSATKLNVHPVSAAKNGTVTTAGEYSFAGLEDPFFAAVVLPQNGATVEVQTYKD